MTSDIIFYHKVKDSYNWHKKYIVPMLPQLHEKPFPPTYHMHSTIGFNNSNVIIGLVKEHGRKYMIYKVGSWKKMIYFPIGPLSSSPLVKS